MDVTAGLCTLLFICTAAAQLNDTAQNATAFALLYGYPLLAFEKLAASIIGTVGVNQIRHGRALSTAANTEVVKLNVDTLYLQAIFDLSHSDVVVTVPEIPSNQFALFSYYDPYGDNFANTGTGNLAAAGQYRLTVPSNGTSRRGVEATNGTASPYQATITSPSLYGIIFVRWLANATNLAAVYAYQDAFGLQNVTRSASVTVGPYLSSLGGTNASLSAAENVLNLLAEMVTYTGPEELANYDTVNSTLEAAGVSGDTYCTN